MDLPQQPWTVANAVAEGQRDALVRFWLAAPADQLEPLWNAGLGGVTQQLVRQLNQQTSFTPHQAELRNAINQQLGVIGLKQPLAHQLLLAVFLLSPPGLFKVANPESQLPPWLLKAYQDLYEAASPVMVLGGQPAPQRQPEVVSLPNPDFGAFPGSLDEMVGNRIQLNRLLGLSNLYYIDPEDREIAQELINLRRSLAELIQKAPEGDLERIWSTDFGDRYWAMVRSGVQNEQLEPADQALRDAATQRLSPASGGGFGTPGALNALLVAMLFYAPGAMRVEGAAQKLPGWILSQYQQVFEQTPVAVA